ncbi:MAG TPA: DNA-binding response regulator [Ignavibacteriales bacterium]|nr:DNA-binding response regulator [Ignavibacteriales bacterium]
MADITIIIADDHPLFRFGVRAELESVSNFKIVAEAENGTEALNLIKEVKPDIAVLDNQMPGLTGIEISCELQKLQNDTKVILLTMHNDKKTYQKAFEAGVKAFVLKDDAVLDIVDAINKVASGSEFISSNLTKIIVNGFAKIPSEDKITGLLNELTPTEKRLLLLISDLKTNDEIADILFISKRTIENHKVSLTRKLQLKSSRDLLKFAIQNKELFKDF